MKSKLNKEIIISEEKFINIRHQLMDMGFSPTKIIYILFILLTIYFYYGN